MIKQSLAKHFKPVKMTQIKRNVHYIKATGEMLKYSDKLGKLPVPELQNTAKTYLESIKPLVKDERQFEEIKTKLNDFIKAGGLGEVLQQRLQARAATTDNWISEWWDEDAYMGYRDPVVPYVSYFFSHAHNLLPDEIEKSQLRKSTLLISKILDFKSLIDSETFPPELAKDTPYCMHGFTMMFNNSRIPAANVDQTVKFDSKELENQFLVVAKNNRFYKLWHHDPKTGERLPSSEIYKNLIKISEDANSKNGAFEAPAVGVLTTLNRDKWYENFERLKSFSIINQNSFEDIFRSSFVLCLDNVSPVSFEERSRNCWHGNGTNRYFDKPLQFFVSANGASGFLGEHSRMDGTPNLTLNNFICQELSKQKKFDFDSATSSSSTEISELKFDVPEVVYEEIQKAEKSFNDTVYGHQLRVWRYQGYGKNTIKKFNTSPDAFIQILIQLAYYKATGTLKPTYESATTRRYKYGRTETNRSVSQEALDFVKTFHDSKASVESKLSAYRAAIAQQNKYVKMASQGLAVDRHIYGLKKCLKPGEHSDFLSHPMTSYSSTWYLSTSQLSSEYFDGYGWSQVHELGYGLAYMIKKESLHVNIVCKNGNPAGLNSDHMHYYLTVAADELASLLSKELKPKL